MTQTIAVDFDGVIHKYSKGWQDGSIYDDAVPGAFDALERLLKRYAVFIHTSRDHEQVALWMAERTDISMRWATDGITKWEFWDQRNCLLVTNKKLPAVAYIDDRGIRFTDWDNALIDLKLAGYES